MAKLVKENKTEIRERGKKKKTFGDKQVREGTKDALTLWKGSRYAQIYAI